MQIPVIDLFAGPGGLGEGFSAYETDSGQHPFKIALSVEKDVDAHKTLLLRSFFRQFGRYDVPDDYYRYLRGDIDRDTLSALWPAQSRGAEAEALLAELGTEDGDFLVAMRMNAFMDTLQSRPWVLIGGPPCQAYSMVGRNRWKNQRPEEFEKDHRHFLYREYLQILAQYCPTVFVMENVPGLLSTVVEGRNIFARILDDLRQPSKALSNGDCGRGRKQLIPWRYEIYSLAVETDSPRGLKPADFIVKSEDYGVPQARHRVILVGVRSDVHIRPKILPKASVRASVAQVIGDLPRLRSSFSRESDSALAWCEILRRVSSQEWVRMLPDRRVRNRIMKRSREIQAGMSSGDSFLSHTCNPSHLREWLHDDRLNGVCNHIAKAHMRSDLYRYMFSACYAEVHGVSPRMRDFPQALWPCHRNIEEAVKGDKFDDRFRVQLANHPSKTITSHIAKDGHYNIHYDPTQCRSLTVREAARLQTFPDNYLFEGNRTAQYRQVGNAVPPYLARQIAGTVHELLMSAHLSECYGRHIDQGKTQLEYVPDPV